jgi:hypothetical protein
LLIGMAGTIRGFALLDLGDTAGAESDARGVLDMVEAYDVCATAGAGPRALLGYTRLAQDDVPAALAVLGELVLMPEETAMLLPRGQAYAGYAEALLAADRVDEAVAVARRGADVTGEDVRSRVVTGLVLARALATAGEECEARSVAAAAVGAAYATEQVSGRAAADELLARLDAGCVGAAGVLRAGVAR